MYTDRYVGRQTDWLDLHFPVEERNFSLVTHQTSSGTYLGPYRDGSGDSFNKANVVTEVHLVQQALQTKTTLLENQANLHIKAGILLKWTALNLFTVWVQQ